MPRLIAIVAMSSNRVIGREGKLPWHFPEDLKFFKRTTLGHPIHTMAPREGLTVIRSAADLPQVCGEAETVFVIGGARVFEELLPRCDGLYLTWIAAPYEGDVLLPPFEHLFSLKEIVGREEGLEFRYYERI